MGVVNDVEQPTQVVRKLDSVAPHTALETVVLVAWSMIGHKKTTRRFCRVERGHTLPSRVAIFGAGRDEPMDLTSVVDGRQSHVA
jgi:hypothetical protein